MRRKRLATKGQKARAQALLDTGLSIGLKTGLTWQLRNIEKAVGGLSRDLESI
jgi:hypothetical protein